MATCGAWPTFHLVGWPGLAAQGAAGGIVCIAAVVSAAVIGRFAKLGPGPAGAAFIFSGMLRAGMSAGLAAGAWAVWQLSVGALVFWLMMFYGMMLAVECVYMTRAVRAI